VAPPPSCAVHPKATAQWCQAHCLIIAFQQALPGHSFQATNMQADRRWAFVQKA
jgi:hypothetical protein